MNRIPKFLISHKKRNKMNNNNKGPKLERRLALRKNIEYDPPDSDTCQSLRTRSLDLAPNNSSFRIHGIQDGEIDMIFQSLGLSPDDFAIPVASWEAHKARSASNVLPRVRQDESERGREREREILGQKPGLDVRNDETCTEREREGGRERETLAEKQGLELLNSDSVVNDATRSNFDVRNDETCRERERGTLSEKRGLDLLNRCEDGEVVASNDRFVAVDGNTRSVLDVREREILGERGFSEEIVTNKTRSISDVSNDGMLSEKRDHYLLNSFDDREVVASNDRFVVVDGNTRSVLDVSSEDTCSQRERETLGETCVTGLSSMFKDSVRVSDQVVTNDQFNVSPIVVSNASSMFDISRGDVNRNPCAITESIDHCSTSRGEIKGLSIDNSSLDCGDHNNVGVNVTKFANIGSMGGIKGVRPPLLAPPPSISARVIDNTSSTWDIMRSFAPDSEENPSPVRERSSYYDDEEEREARLRGSAAFLSESCSFTTTSNDDDSSSSTTEPMSNISPNARFKRVITYWEKGELLGRGSFGTVYEGIADGGYFIAIKEVSLLDQGDMGRQSIYQLEQEIALLSQFENENIVQYLGTDKDEAHLYIFLELVTKGSLLSLYQKYHLRDSQVSSYTRQILHGLKYLHERNVVHRDIKCANILVGADGSVKLADFGLAKATKLNDVKSCKGTAFWMAPEVVRGRHQGYGLPADIWSLGCTVLEMLTRRIPYSPLECMPALFRIGRGEPPPIPDSLSRDAQDFISRCLKVDPNDRPTATQLLEHSFVRRPLSTSSGSSSPYHHPIGRGLNFSSK